MLKLHLRPFSRKVRRPRERIKKKEKGDSKDYRKFIGAIENEFKFLRFKKYAEMLTKEYSDHPYITLLK